MQKIVECVPNFSEGRDRNLIRKITDQVAAVRGVQLLDVDSGESTNRTVVTFIGEPAAVQEAAFRAVKAAAELIDMTQHHGEHPRMGATDVLPFVPVANVTMEECVEMARQVGRRIGGELGIPVYLYEHAATRPERRNLASIRAGEYEGLPQKLADPNWQPDFGPAQFNARSGATAVGAREFLIAYNINLNTTDRRYATDIAYELRERGRCKRTGNTSPFYYKGEQVYFTAGQFPCGNCDFVAASFEELAEHYRQKYGGDLYARYKALGMNPENLTGSPVYRDGLFSHVKAVGWVVEAYKRAQISINLTNFKITPAHAVLEAARTLAAQRGIIVTGSEIVGVVPFAAMFESGKFYLRRMHKSTGIPVRDVLETAVQSLGLRDVTEFDIDKKIIGIPPRDGRLVQQKITDFVDEVSRDTPAPGGGSIAALAGSLGAALAAMVANVSNGRGEFDGKYEEICELAEQAQRVKDDLLRAVDEDAAAFNVVLEAMRLPKDTPAQQEARAVALREAYKAAARVPLRTAELCREALQLCWRAARLGNKAVMSDAGVAALVAFAGLQGAIYNVRINLPNTRTPEFITAMNNTLDGLRQEGKALCEQVQVEVERSLA
ncbi:MAG: glutamate formimidoyltransferase [candidate division KSB1 bacterium]|nr:glutamate formimidoyltransferase [candidate division KSB1 bacterium]MDZ7272804.1 glutamate formimidoyltransferase [candidate division KSB1 bacterium]MDZ7284172.1 glutamate formimidoyltransferase [candidate division KSB1 bacterium]MDZ7297430.1 glutamate formimidoyltransferase [candidate division KSB1 bacterium]MDZ7308178.1 glutamate formimidoyltransferase [candidate division KSB1 bacterium]